MAAHPEDLDLVLDEHGFLYDRDIEGEVFYWLYFAPWQTNEDTSDDDEEEDCEADAFE